MNLKELRNKARKGIEPDREYNSHLLPQKTFLGIDFGIADSTKFFFRHRNDDIAKSALKEFERLVEVDRDTLEKVISRKITGFSVSGRAKRK